MTQDNSHNVRPLPVVLIVIILAVIAVGGWWVKSRPVAPSTASNIPQTTTPLPTQPAKQQTELTLYVPNDSAMLEKQTDKVTVDSSSPFEDLAKKAFALLQQKAPKNYPNGAELLDVKTGKDGTAILNFNSNFKNASFWQGSTRTLIGIYSIVNTVTAIPADDFKAQQVEFQVEGKPIAVLGELDVSDPLKSEMQWVQKN